MRYLYPKHIIYLHKAIIAVSGGSLGVRDPGLLESAVYRLQATFGGRDLYPDLFAKTAALGHSIISNHPFIDGNRRTGFEAMRLLLRLNGCDINASENEKFTFVMSIAGEKLDEHAITEWLRTHKTAYKMTGKSR